MSKNDNILIDLRDFIPFFFSQKSGLFDRFLEESARKGGKVKIYQTRTGVVLPKSLNSFYITGNFSSKNELLKDLGVTKIIYFDSDNGIQEKNLN